MNYITEINAFYDWVELSELSHSARHLWHVLMHLANRAKWQVSLTVPLSVLECKTGMNQQMIKRARNELEQAGRITWKSRKGNQSAVYGLNPFAVQNAVQNDANNEPQPVPQYEPQPVPQNEPIYKHKQNETNLSPNGDKKARVKKAVDYASLIEAFTDDAGLRDSLTAYVKMRVANKRPPTEEAMRLVFKHLHGFAKDTAGMIAVLDQSTRNGWTDIYALKGQGDKAAWSGSEKKPRSLQYSQRTYTAEALDALIMPLDGE